MRQYQITHFFVFALSVIFLHSGLLSAQETKKYCDSLIKAAAEKSNNNDHIKSLELLKKAQAIAQKHNWHSELFEAKNDIGASYFSLLDYGAALKYYHQAYTLAVKDGKPKSEVMALNNIAILYATEKNHKKAHDYFKKAFDISKEINDSINIGVYALNLGLVMNEMDNLRQSRIYLDQALQYSKKRPHLNTVVRTAIAENEMGQGHQQKARSMAATILAGIPERKGNQTAVTLLVIQSKSFIKDKNYKEALSYAQIALANNVADPIVEKIIYETLAEISGAMKSYPEALRFKDSVFSVQEKINHLKYTQEYENNKVKFELQDYENQIALNEATIAGDRKMFYSVLGGLVVVIGLIFMIFRNIAMRHKQRNLTAENKQQELALLLAKQESEALLKEKEFHERQHEILLEQEYLKQEIEYKNRKLSSKALYVSGKNQLVEEIVGMLSDEPEVAKLPAVQKHIRHLKNSLSANNEWGNFLTHFEEVNQGFLSRLKAKHPELTSNDIRFICYIFMNLNGKEIAAMLNISSDACRKRKERIAQKIGLKDSASLYGYLSEIQVVLVN